MTLDDEEDGVVESEMQITEGESPEDVVDAGEIICLFAFSTSLVLVLASLILGILSSSGVFTFSFLQKVMSP